MSEIMIRPFEATDLERLESIFFASSTRQEFKDEEERRAFQYKYLGYYLKHYPKLALVAQGKEILGYCVAAPQSSASELREIQPHLELFQESFAAYPAHLHINLAQAARGKGVGSQLILALEPLLQAQGIAGLHIMTSPGSRNRSFYQRLGFDFEVEQSFKGSPILLMGKKL